MAKALASVSKGYLVGYLLTGGALFTLAPQLGLRLFMADHPYESVMVRLCGILLLGLATIVTLGYRNGWSGFPKATLVTRTVILTGMVVLYLISGETMVLLLCGVVGLGMVLTMLAVSRGAFQQIPQKNLKKRDRSSDCRT